MILDLTLPQVLALVVVVIGATCDLATWKIPNWLTFTAAGCGIVLGFAGNGWAGAAWAVGGWLTGSGISLVAKMIPVALKLYRDVPIGYGDTKLIAAVGTFLGPVTVVLVFYFFCLFYGLLSVGHLLKVIPWVNFGLAFFLPKSSSPLAGLDLAKVREAGKSTIPLGPAIAAATVSAIFLEKPILYFLGFR